ncbi:MAG: TetR family transcriptional regulator [Vicinamibacteraceae bacterium]
MDEPEQVTARRSDETRARILRAARESFAADGYERTTIRAVAAKADIDPSMVMRYFGNKDGLFAAAASFDLRLPDLGTHPRQKLGVALVRHFLARWEGDASDNALRVLLKTAASHDRAAERMREIFRSQLVPALAAVVPKNEAAARAGLVATQMLGLAFCRYVLRLPGIVDLGHDAIAARLGPTIQRYLSDSLR